MHGGTPQGEKGTLSVTPALVRPAVQSLIPSALDSMGYPGLPRHSTLLLPHPPAPSSLGYY